MSQQPEVNIPAGGGAHWNVTALRFPFDDGYSAGYHATLHLADLEHIAAYAFAGAATLQRCSRVELVLDDVSIVIPTDAAQADVEAFLASAEAYIGGTA